MERAAIKNAKKIIIKIGSKVLLSERGSPDYDHINNLVRQIAILHKQGKEIVFVTSGATGAGMEALGLLKRPTDMPTVQACAAIGQVRLMRTYEAMFSEQGIHIGQVLLTHDDLKHRKRHLNIKHTFRSLIERRVIPVVNENDTVSVREIKFGDNDVLASLTAMLLEYEVLVLLTTSDGFLSAKNGQKERVSHIPQISEEVLSQVEKHKIGLSLGGMQSKLLAASNMSHVGGLSVIAPGHKPNVLLDIFAGLDVGTVVGLKRSEKNLSMSSKKRWIAFYHRSSGGLVVDAGAENAIKNSGKSLLAIGVKSVEGEFSLGDIVEIKDLSGKSFAKGIAQFTSPDLKRIMGQDSAKIKDILGHRHYDEVVHRDNLVLLGG